VWCQIEWTPLHYAVQRSHKVIISMLIDKGANVNAQSKVCECNNTRNDEK
jgi:ankyrin repeat protein